MFVSALRIASWHVKTRAKPVQVFFDNGDPHGKDQFISITSTGWSIGALARTLPRAAPR
jgi:N-acyl-D-amino-acid deacylase